MKFVIDRVENNIAVLENIKNNEVINVDINELPKKAKEKDAVFYNGKEYVLDGAEKEERIKRIEEKMKKLKDSR